MENCAVCCSNFKRRLIGCGYQKKTLSSKLRNGTVTFRDAILQLNPNQVLSGSHICDSCGLCVERAYRKVVAHTVTITTESEPGTVTANNKPRSSCDPSFPLRRRKHGSQYPHALVERRSVTSIKKSICGSLVKSNYPVVYSKLLSSGRAARKAFMAVVQSAVRTEMRAFLRNKSEDNQFLQFDGTCGDLESFDWSKLVTGLGNKFPVLMAAMSGSLPKHMSEKMDDGKLISAMRLGMMMSIALFSHKPSTFKLIQAINAIEMWKCGTSKKLFTCFNRLGLSQGFAAACHNVNLIISPSDPITEESQQRPDASSNVSQMELDEEDEQRCQSKNICGSSTQPDDGTSLIPANVGSGKQCVCHVLTDCENDEIKSFNNRTWIRLCEFMATWKDLDGTFHHLATCFDATKAHNGGYHAKCYLSFTDDRKVSHARVVAMTSGVRNGNLPNVVKNSDATKMSHIAGAGQRFKIGECFLCRGQRYCYDRFTGFRKLKELRCCNFSNKGRSLPGIRAVALRRGDEAVLDCFRRHDEDRGFVLKYHNLCYMQYVSSSKKLNTVPRSITSVRNQEFNKFFGNIIDKWIIEGGEMLTLSELKKMLIIHVEHSMAVSLSNNTSLYWKQELRERLQVHYGDRIAFIQISGRHSSFVLSSATLQQILAVADGLPATSTEQLVNIETQISEPSVVLRSATNSGASVYNSITQAEIKVDATAQRSTETVDELSDLLDVDICNADEMRLANHCQELLEDISNLDKHLSENSNCGTQCHDINDDVDCGTGLSEPQPLKCNSCLKHYETSELLNEHKKKCRALVKWNSLLKLFNCKLCNKWFREQVPFKKHMKIHRRLELKDRDIKRYYRCQECALWFATANGLKLHTVSHLNTPAAKRHRRQRTGTTSICQHRSGTTATICQHSCTHCDMDFRSQSLLDEHIVSQHGIKAYCCAHCDKRFPSKLSLAHHVVIHDHDRVTVKSFLCEFCSLSFVKNLYLQNHIAKYHMDERPYVCQDCNKSFGVAASLISHSLCHVSVKLFMCEFCGKDFKTKSQLNQHTKSHTKPYCCQVCSERFALSSYLKLHLKKHQLLTNVSTRCTRSTNNFSSCSDSQVSFSSDAATSTKHQTQQQQSSVDDTRHLPPYFDKQFQQVTDHTYFITDSIVECEEEMIADSENFQDMELFFTNME